MSEASEQILMLDGQWLLVAPNELPEPPGPAWFDPEFWRGRGQLAGAASGRGQVHFIQGEGYSWALRHFMRGGLVARFNRDRYWFSSQDRVRSFAEWRLLRQMSRWQLPVPAAVAAGYSRSGPWYRADLITARIEHQQTLAQALAGGPADPDVFARVGSLVRQFHGRGVFHADLNCHNILLAESRLWLIDFDRGAIMSPGRWQQENLERLRRSVYKVTPESLRSRLPAAWDSLLASYNSA
ncbi:MAG: 3-deoxy-D-manno-octulosonic acid kinase [Xanthomonadales bacterium]|nr:3-deoxy-D-manno-octulosonic acid kinase [Xanthomonadales bacterium]